MSLEVINIQRNRNGLSYWFFNLVVVLSYIWSYLQIKVCNEELSVCVIPCAYSLYSLSLSHTHTHKANENYLSTSTTSSSPHPFVTTTSSLPLTPLHQSFQKFPIFLHHDLCLVEYYSRIYSCNKFNRI
ncbi:hypothetical protein Pfo_004903 [Paulownia fortunei]|nr:hypothetical protein Pfo_004903 [Paulownia fortunei]